MLEKLNERFGYYRQGGDSYALEHGWINEAQFLAMVQRNALWMAEISAWVYGNYQPDLIFTWQQVFDSAGHVFYLRDPRQVRYDDSSVDLYRDYYQQAAYIADQALMIILAGTDLSNATVILASDHGMTPVHTNVYVNTVLEQNGYLVLDERNYVVVEESKALAFTSGGAMHIYINLVDHERDGFVSPEEYPIIKGQIVDLFLSLQDPDTGEDIFQTVLSGEGLGALGLDHPNSGDIFAQAYPGYNLDSWRGKDDVFSPSTLLGQHGFDSQHPDMWGIFIAAGYDIRPIEQDIQPFNLIDIAPSVAELIGILPSATSDGVVIPELVGD
jgi:predicted AlkP superfamily phosphohydrolase/phosphomutase